MTKLKLVLPHAECDVFIGDGILSKLPRTLRSIFGRARPVVCADGHLLPYAMRLSKEAIALPPGEATKNPRQLVRLWNLFAQRRVDRHTPVVAVGGGVVADLVGFAAATYMRGVPLVQVPTTLLAQVDAAIGGKTAVNLPSGKNLAGAFYQPRLVVIDPAVLATLSERHYRTGLAETLKYGIIKDPALFRLMEENVGLLRLREKKLLEEIVVRCVKIKLAVVKADERERGPRMILNYGHTIGHAVEKASRYRLTHGEAISIGMNLEGRLAVELGLWTERGLERQNALLEVLGLPLERRYPREVIRRAMSLDKKARAGKIRFVLPTAIGRVKFPVEVPWRLVEKVLG